VHCVDTAQTNSAVSDNESAKCKSAYSTSRDTLRGQSSSRKLKSCPPQFAVVTAADRLVHCFYLSVFDYVPEVNV